MAKKKKAAAKKTVAVHAARLGVRGGAMMAAGGRADDGPLPCPVATDPAMGDKTPGVMAWYREHEPEEYARRYANRVYPGVGDMVDKMRSREYELGPVSDFEDEEDEAVVVKPRVIMR